MTKTKKQLVELRNSIADELQACRSGIRRAKNELKALRKRKYSDMSQTTSVDKDINVVAQQLAQLHDIESKLEGQLVRANSRLLQLQSKQ